VKDSFELAWSDWQGSAQFDRLDDQDRWAVQWARAYVEWAAGEKRGWLVRRGVTLTPIVGWAERGDLRPTGTATPSRASTSRGAPARASSSPSSARRTRRLRTGLLTFHPRHRVDELVLSVGHRDGRARGTAAPPTTVRGARPPAGTPSAEFELSAQAVVVTPVGSRRPRPVAAVSRAPRHAARGRW
jgi:predicted oxidoreductase